MEKELKNDVTSSDKTAVDNLPVGTEKPSEQASAAPQGQSMNDFIRNEDNRRTAYAHALNLWKIVSGNEPIENAVDRVITETEVVHKTTLSHKKAKELFNLLHTFGFLRYIDKINFLLLFDSDQQRKTIRYEIDAMTDALSNDIARYKICLKNDTTLSEEAKKKMYEDFKSAILNSILF